MINEMNILLQITLSTIYCISALVTIILLIEFEKNYEDHRTVRYRTCDKFSYTHTMRLLLLGFTPIVNTFVYFIIQKYKYKPLVLACVILDLHLGIIEKKTSY